MLDGLTGHGVPVPYSCRAGLCQTCLLRATEGTPPPEAQAGLKDSLKARNYFLACVCHPERDLQVVLPDAAAGKTTATVRGLDRLSGEIMRVALECHALFDYRAGQFLSLFRDGQRARSYSIASVPGLDAEVHLHVRRYPGGQVSGWVHEELRPGQTVTVQGPAGDCFYLPGQPEQPLLLIGTGSGLAPLYGILRDALAQGHAGPIRLFHGSRAPEGLYLAEELRALARRHANFDYNPCLSSADAPAGYAQGRAQDIALREIPKLGGWRIYLCGHPEMVKQGKRKAFLAGAALSDIHADAFAASAAAPGASA